MALVRVARYIRLTSYFPRKEKKPFQAYRSHPVRRSRNIDCVKRLDLISDDSNTAAGRARHCIVQVHARCLRELAFADSITHIINSSLKRAQFHLAQLRV